MSRVLRLSIPVVVGILLFGVQVAHAQQCGEGFDADWFTCRDLFGGPPCHCWAYLEPLDDRGWDKHIAGPGTNCSGVGGGWYDEHHGEACAGLALSEVDPDAAMAVKRAVEANDVLQLARVAESTDFAWLEYNAGREMVQLLAACGSYPDGQVIAQIPVDSAAAERFVRGAGAVGSLGFLTRR